jgi:hypothetical protein
MKIDFNQHSGYVVEDMYSSRANPNRGYHDYIKRITFWRRSEEFEVKMVSRLHAELASDKCYMWCNNAVTLVSRSDKFPTVSVYEINYGYDSGD